MTRGLLLTVAAIALAGCSPPAPPALAPVPDPAVAAPGPVVGVLEDRPGATVGETPRFVVRAVFFKAEDGWHAFPSDCGNEACLAASLKDVPAQTEWTISLDGASLGQQTSRAPATVTYYADIGRQDIVAGAAVPTSGERSMAFAGWVGEPVFRPLVATSGGGFADLDAWATAPLAETSIEALRKQFRVQFPDVQNCASPEANVAGPYSYKNSDIVIGYAQTSASGWSVATLSVTGYLCDGPMESSAFAPQTFALSPAGEAKYLAEGLQMVDAGDFDADGRSEVLFAIDAYNRGGYELYHGDFTGTAVFAFGYH